MFFLQTRSPLHHVFLIGLSAGSLNMSTCNKRVGSTASIVGHSSRPAWYGTVRDQIGVARLARLLIRTVPGQSTCRDLSPSTARRLVIRAGRARYSKLCMLCSSSGILSTTSSFQNFNIYFNFTSKNLEYSHIQTYTYAQRETYTFKHSQMYIDKKNI